MRSGNGAIFTTFGVLKSSTRFYTFYTAKPKFGSWIMCLAAKDAKTAKNMQSDRVFGGLYTGRQIDMISPTG